MRAKKWLTIITGGIAIVSLLMVVTIDSHDENTLYDISLAILGSAMLGFVMSLTEYFTERRRAMIAFWEEALSVVRVLNKMEPFSVPEPEQLILNCFSEEAYNDLDSFDEESRNRLRSSLPSHLQQLGLSPKHDAKEALTSWLKANNPLPPLEGKALDDYLEKAYQHKIERYRADMQAVIDSYLAVAHTDFQDLTNACDNLDFLVENTTIRKELAVERIYNEIMAIRDIVLRDIHNLEGWKGKNASFPIAAERAAEISSQIFEKREEITNDSDTWIMWYPTRLKKIENALEEFRCEIFRKQRPAKQDPHPVCAIQCSNSQNNKCG